MSFLYKNIVANPVCHAAPLLAGIAANIGASATEHLIVGYFDAKGNLLKATELCSSHCRSINIPYRQIVHNALNCQAHSIVLIHNHPSGDPSPSRADKSQTRNIARVLKALDIHVDDHLIVAGDRLFSFYAAGLL
jgi:DNA repair protein RadC